MTGYHEAPEAGQLLETGPEVVKTQRVAKERAAQKICSWTVQNEVGIYEYLQTLQGEFSILLILER